MSFEVTKGGSFDINKAVAAIYAGAGWDVGDNVDVDLNVIAISKGKVVDTHVLSWCNSPQYNKKDAKLVVDGQKFKTVDGSMRHTGDNLTGVGRGDDEGVVVDLNTLPSSIDELAFWVTIYDAANRGQDFGMVKNAFIRVVDGENPNGTEIARYNLTDEFGGKTSVQVGSQILLPDGTWKYTAVGVGSNATIQQIIAQYQ